MSMNDSLREAAATGNIDAFYALIQKDPYMLERIDHIPFIDTPLHIAATEGQIKLAMEMMNLKPSFARKLSQDGFSPMHLAFRNGHTKLLLRLLKTDKDLARVKGREGMTPFHCAATMGNSNLLFHFLEACPECIEDVTVRDETALHLALKNDLLEAFNLLTGWLQSNRRRGANELEKKVINWRDDDGNTVLHIAAIKCDNIYLYVTAKNSDGLTSREIIEKVERRGTHWHKRRLTMLVRARNGLSGDMINATLVVATLVITAVYQSSLSPPRGVWQGDNNSIPTTNSNTLQILDDNYNKSRFKHLLGEETRKTGTTVMNPDMYYGFWVYNLIAYGLPVLLTVFLLSNVPRLLLIPLYYLSVSYFYSMTIISPSSFWVDVNYILANVTAAIPFALLFGVIRLWMSPNHKEFRQLHRLLRSGNLVIIMFIFNYVIDFFF
ncbi:ankyrin repeat-containing protein BDA1 [Gossypium raimondii]|uniref:ankyrin repeat-containing protein BDA1 n=1 Tax=Gossypium raimondii TaxID=29730 RepID=UPI00227B8F44|nr:ankyrin repeat-containing protein BDA1 [Gossypium raimondii]